MTWIGKQSESLGSHYSECWRYAGHTACAVAEIASLTARLAEAEARLRKYEPEPDKCEHGVAEGDWCEPCNKAYKEAADEAAKGGRDE